MTQAEPTEELSRQEEREREALRSLMQARLSSISQQKAGLEREAAAIREFLRSSRPLDSIT